MTMNKVFCVSNNDSGWFPAEFAYDKGWQFATGFRPEEVKKPEPLTATTEEKPKTKTKKQP